MDGGILAWYDHCHWADNTVVYNNMSVWLDHLKHMAAVKESSNDRVAAQWAVSRIEELTKERDDIAVACIKQIKRLGDELDKYK
jgi:hypothetical protein